MNSSLSKTNQNLSDNLSKPQIKPIICQYSRALYPNIEKKRRFNKFSHLSLCLTTRANLTKTAQTLKEIKHIAHLDLLFDSFPQDLAKKLKYFLSSLKRFNRIPSLQINYLNLPQKDFAKFCLALKSLKTPKKLELQFRFSNRDRDLEVGPIIAALKKYRDLQALSIKLLSVEALKPKSLELLFSSLRNRSKFESLSIELPTLNNLQAEAFIKALDNLRNVNLLNLQLKLRRALELSEKFKDLSRSLTNFGSSLQGLSLEFCPAGDILIFPEFLEKFKTLSHLSLNLITQDLPLAFLYIQNLAKALNSMENLPSRFKVGFNQSSPLVGSNLSDQSFLQIYKEILASSSWIPNIQVSQKENQKFIVESFYLENSQPRHSGLSLNFANTKDISEAVSLLGRFNDSITLTLHFVFCPMLNVPGLNQIFESLKKFKKLTRLTFSFEKQFQINKDWVINLFDLMPGLPRSIVSLNLKFLACVQMTAEDRLLVVRSLDKLNKIKNITMFGLTFEEMSEITDDIVIELGRALKGLRNLTSLDVSLTGCPILYDQGAISLLEDVKTMESLQELHVNFKDCWNLQQSTKSKFQINAQNISIKFIDY